MVICYHPLQQKKLMGAACSVMGFGATLWASPGLDSTEGRTKSVCYVDNPVKDMGIAHQSAGGLMNWLLKLLLHCLITGLEHQSDTDVLTIITQGIVHQSSLKCFCLTACQLPGFRPGFMTKAVYTRQKFTLLFKSLVSSKPFCITTGKRQTLTLKKNENQKCFLLHPMKNFHMKFG